MAFVITCKDPNNPNSTMYWPKKLKLKLNFAKAVQRIDDMTFNDARIIHFYKNYYGHIFESVEYAAQYKTNANAWRAVNQILQDKDFNMTHVNFDVIQMAAEKTNEVLIKENNKFNVWVKNRKTFCISCGILLTKEFPRCQPGKYTQSICPWCIIEMAEKAKEFLAEHDDRERIKDLERERVFARL
jgi:hypothetical protein